MTKTLQKVFSSLIILALALALVPTQFSANAATSELFISEYIEGGSFNKAIEIYNGTGGTVDLSTYTLELYSNGATSPNASMTLSGMLADGDVYVVVHGSANAVILAASDATNNSVINFNGDDAVVLKHNGAVIDVIGQVGFRPVPEWGTGDASTQNNTIQRKVDVCAGDADSSNAFDPSVEWDGFAQDYSDGLGSHIANCDGGDIAPTVASTTPGNGASNVAVDANIEINFSEDVTVTGSWFDISCTSSGVHTATVSGGSQSYTLNPDADFDESESCIVTVTAAQVADIDGTLDNMVADYVFTFTILTPPIPGIVINEILADPASGSAGDANGDGTRDGSDDEFVEIFNDTGDDLDISGWTLKDAVSVRHTFPSGTVVPASCSVVVFGGGTPTGKFGTSLVQTASGGNLGLNNNGDTVTLNDGITDQASYIYSGEGNDDQSLTRNPDVTGADPLIQHSTVTGADGALFSPGTLVDGSYFTGCLGEKKINQVQGSGSASPLVGRAVTIEGIVVGDYQEYGQLGGFNVQEEDTDVDGNLATSEGVFVYNYWNSVSVGDLVQVTGRVSEYFGLTEINNVTEVVVVGSGNPLPTASALLLPVTTINDFEAYEGMYVTFPQQLTVTETYSLARYGQVSLSVNGRLPNPTHIATPGAAANAQADLNSRSRIELDDANTWQNKDPITYPYPGLSASNTLRGGSTVTDLVGVLDYSFGIYRVQPVGDVIFSNDNPRTATPTDVDGTLKAASFNVLNYFNGDGLGGGFPTPRGANSASEFARQQAKIVSAIVAMDADVVGLMEIENDGYGSESAIADLVDALNAVAGAGTYAYIDPGVSVIGTDEIAVGFIYQPATVSPIGASAILDSSVDPTFNDEKNRPALAQTFQENATAGRFTAVVNHFKSKGSDCNSLDDPDLGDGQGNCNLTRTSAAVALANWLATDPTSSNDPDYLILGDLNSYAMEDPITALKNAGYTDLAASFLGTSAYSYVFAGEWGYLDYGMSNGSLTTQVTGVTEWHINADEPPALDYNEEYKSAGQITSLYSPDAYRASDHDPVVVGLGMTTEQEISELIDAVQALVDEGLLNDGQGNALTSKLENVLAKLAKGNTNAAANQLGAFINQVEDFVDEGILTTEQGDILIEAATVLVNVFK